MDDSGSVLTSAPFALALPDISPEIYDVAVDFDATVDPGDVEEGCAGAQTGRVLVNFTTKSHSLGPHDLFLGDPGCPNCALNPGAPCANPYYVCSTAHGHAHFESFAKADLLDANGNIVVTGKKQGFCLEDFDCPNPKFDCGNQGITVGCSDVYAAGLPCQYVDITDAHLPDGDYTLRVTQDPDNVIAEANEGNNVATATVHLGPPTTPPPTTCPVYSATDLPQAIPDLGEATSIVHDPRAGVIERVRVVDLHGTHTFVKDLSFALASPSGTSVVLMDQICGGDDDFRLDLADAAITPIPCPPNVGGLHQPLQPLAAFVGQPAAGNWTLVVSDLAGADVGTLDGWGLEVCTKCGNGTLDPAEVCDDGNANNGDCCSSDCQTPAPNGVPCDDPRACTIGGACLGGSCNGGTVSCDPCLTCDPPLGCIPPTNVLCDFEPPRSASVILAKHPVDASHDKLTWKWKNDFPVTLLDYGSPTTVTDLILCVFDQTGLKLSATAACRWDVSRERRAGSRGRFSIHTPNNDASPDGITRLTATAGAPGGRASHCAARVPTCRFPPSA